MTRTGRYSLMAVLAGAAAVGSCKGGQRSASPQEIEELRTQVQATQDSLDIFKDKVKKYFKHTGPEVDSPSFYEYVDSLALLVCELRDKASPKPPPYGICPAPERQEKIPPPTYPPR